MPSPVSNPPNPWASTHVEWLDAPPDARLEVFEEEAKSVLSENDSPDVGFRFSVKTNDSTFGKRMRGTGPRWDVIVDLFETTCRRLGLDTGDAAPGPSRFRRPAAEPTLFDV